MNDRQIHLDQFEHRTHRVSEKPFAPGVITNGRELGSSRVVKGGLVRCVTWALVMATVLLMAYGLISVIEYVKTPDMIGSKQ